MTTTNHLIGRCTAKGCKTTARVTADTTLRGRPAFTIIRLRGHGDPYDPVWTVDSDVVAARNIDRLAGGFLPQCVAHRRTLRWDTVSGRRADDVKCSASCRQARRADCECSCAGENHGAGHGA